jgi:hypothetical protein
MKSHLAIALMLLLLPACRVQENARTSLGTPGTPNSAEFASLGAGSRPETSREPDAPSLAGPNQLSRAHWDVASVVVPADSIHGYRTYARTRLWSDATARQRGDYPTPATALDSGDGWDTDSALETLASGPGSLYDGVLILPRMLFVSPREPVRHYPSGVWRAPAHTARHTSAELAARAIPEASSDASGPPSRADVPTEIPPHQQP